MQHKNYELLDSVEKYVKRFIVDNFRAPTTADISQEFNISRTGAFRYLTELGRQGRIEYIDGKVSYPKVKPAVAIPLVSRDTAISNLDDEAVVEYIPLPQKYIGEGKHFAVRMYDDSLKDCGYRKNDLLVFTVQDTAADGDIVAVSSLDEPLALCRYPITGHGSNTAEFNIEGIAVFAMCGLELEQE